MSIMTQEQYDERKASVVTALSHAEGEYQSASFKELTGNGSPDGSAKAKRHLDLLREELTKIEAAWVASQIEIERLRCKGLADDFDFAASEIEALLIDRKKAVREVVKAAQAIAQGLARYQEGTNKIRLKSTSLARGANAASSSLHAQVTGPLFFNVAATAFSAILNTAHISLTTSSFLSEAFPNGDPVAFEELLASKVREAIRCAAPLAEAA